MISPSAEFWVQSPSFMRSHGANTQNEPEMLLRSIGSFLQLTPAPFTSLKLTGLSRRLLSAQVPQSSQLLPGSLPTKVSKRLELAKTPISPIARLSKISRRAAVRNKRYYPFCSLREVSRHSSGFPMGTVALSSIPAVLLKRLVRLPSFVFVPARK